MKSHNSSSSDKPAAGGKSPALEEQQGRVPAVSYVGKPLDGSQYHDVVEEQIYSEQRPRPEEEQPRRSRASQDGTP